MGDNDARAGSSVQAPPQSVRYEWRPHLRMLRNHRCRGTERKGGIVMSNYDAWSTLFNCLQAKPRRRLLTGLSGYQPKETIHFTELRHDEQAPETPIHAEYVYRHLPELAAAGYILWDEQTHEISQGPRFREIEPFIELLQTHSGQLPDGWV